MPRDQRKIVLIDRKFQYRQMRTFVGLNTLILASSGTVLYLFLNSRLEAGLLSAHMSFDNLREMLFPVLFALSLFNIVISSVVISWFVLHASHKVAGPLYRVKSAIDDLADRNLATLTTIRSKDQLQELAASLSKLKEILQQDHAAIQTKAQELRALLHAGASGELATRKLAELESIVSQYRL